MWPMNNKGEFMEIFGIAILVSLVVLNASSFFGAASHQKRLYNRTAADTDFNKSAHQTQ